MNKAFIFDMDGVIVDTERTWNTHGETFLEDLFGAQIAAKIGDPIGMTVNEIYTKAVHLGLSMDREVYDRLYDQKAADMYALAGITHGIDDLAEALIKQDYKLALVSSSPRRWINKVLARISFAQDFHQIIAINDRDDIKPKPAPDAYLEAIKTLETEPQFAIVLEDSNRGIQAAKSAGAFTIGLRENLVPGYIQEGADAYVNTPLEVLKILKTRSLPKK